MRAIFSLLVAIGISTSSPSAWAQCTSCEDCPPPAIVGSPQMILNQIQPLAISGGMAPYTWDLAEGGGALSSSSGLSVTYSAPAANPHCMQNPTIQVIDACGRSGFLHLAVTNPTLGAFDPAGVIVERIGDGLSMAWIVAQPFNCGGSITGFMAWPCDTCHMTCCQGVGGCPLQAYLRLDDDWGCEFNCTEAAQIARCENPAPCQGSCEPGYRDVRTEAMRAAGCCPAGLLPQGPPVPCVKIAEFRTDRRLINSSAGEEVNFQGNLSARAGTSVDWALQIAGRTFSGSGNSVRAVWDGKDVSGKQVDPGDYTARLEVKASGVCRGSAAKETQVKVAPSEEDRCLDAAF